MKFTFFWVAFNYSIGSFEHMDERPMGVHQGAQCDRASLALNYYYNGMRFLYPEVHENNCRDGIVSCELPLSNYLSACLYKLFGFNEKWFRLLTFCFVSVGMFALFLLFKLYVKTVVAYLLVFILNSSHILLFYATNFIPDAGSLGMALLAWYLFFRLFIEHAYLPNFKKNRGFILFAVVLGFAIASKTTCAVQWMTMCGILLLSYFKPLKIELRERKKLWLTLICALAIPVLWQYWAQHLGRIHNSQFFMLRIPTVDSWADYHWAWCVYLSNWPFETFAYPLHFIVAAFLLLPLFLKRYIPKNLWYISLINTVGSFFFMALMIKQFMYHDYYILCLLPSIVINWIALASWVIKWDSGYWWLKLILFAGIGYVFVFHYNYGKKLLAMRYEKGNYWEQSQQNTEDYTRFKTKINQLGIDKKQCVLVGYDSAPNNMLYLLDLSGRRINRDFSNEQIKELINGLKPNYMVSCDSAFTEKMKPYFRSMAPVTNEKYLILFKVGY